jgi:hypothetical protein
MKRIVMKKHINAQYPQGIFFPVEWKDIKKGDVLQFWEDAVNLVALPNGITEVTAVADAKLSEPVWGVEVEYNVTVQATMEL